MGLRLVLSAFVLCALSGTAQPAIRTDSYRVVHVYPHDPEAFTQGLIYVDGHLYESTGLNGQSSLRMVDLETGRVLQQYELPREYFGEGLTDWGSDLVEITWRSEVAFFYDRFSFGLRRTLHYKGEGWGLTHDRRSLIMSDGSAVLRFFDPNSFREIRRISVHDDKGRPVPSLNELEYVGGEIYANIWHSDEIARISARSGAVLGWINLAGIIDKCELPSKEAVLNGIAYDEKSGRLFVTGKLWPKLFEIRVVER